MDWTAIEAVDWSKLGEPRIPELLKGLVSADEAVRTKSAKDFEEYVIHPSAGWQAFDAGFGISRILTTDLQVQVIPFLIELAETVNSNFAPRLLSFLHEFTFYSNMADEGKIYKQRARLIWEAVWEGQATYVNLLRSSSPELRLSAFFLLAEFSEYFDNIHLILFRAIEAESHEKTKERMLDTFKSLP